MTCSFFITVTPYTAGVCLLAVTAGHVVVQSVNAADLLRAHTAEMKQRQEARRASHQAAPPVAPAPARPQIGRGSAPGGQISFDFDDTSLLRTAKAQRPSARAELAKVGAACTRGRHARGGFALTTPFQDRCIFQFFNFNFLLCSYFSIIQLKIVEGKKLPVL